MHYQVELTCPDCGGEMEHVDGSPPNGQWAAAIARCIRGRLCAGREFTVMAKLTRRPTP